MNATKHLNILQQKSKNSITGPWTAAASSVRQASSSLALRLDELAFILRRGPLGGRASPGGRGRPPRGWCRRLGQLYCHSPPLLASPGRLHIHRNQALDVPRN
jgi:hypothetical protein